MFEIENLSVSYGEKRILEDINLKIREKEITAIIGPSGCGKTSFINTLNRMIEDNGGNFEGTIKIKGQDIRDFTLEELRKNIGMVFQIPKPFPFSIYENLSYGPKYYGLNKKEVDRLVELSLKKVGLYEEVRGEIKKTALSLSGGQQQRLCIARALTVDPKVLILDEPCSALDVKNTKIIEDLLLDLAKDYTIIIVTHNLGQAKRISSRTVFFQDGKLIEEGATEKIFKKPEKEETREYIYLFN